MLKDPQNPLPGNFNSGSYDTVTQDHILKKLKPFGAENCNTKSWFFVKTGNFCGPVTGKIF